MSPPTHELNRAHETHEPTALVASRRPLLRMTPQRQAVLEAVQASDDHPRAADIYERVRTSMPRIAFGTVYNALHALAEHGIILQLTFGDYASRFDARVDRHDHAICTSCGDLADTEAPPTPDTINRAAAATGFEIHEHHTQLLGRCATCRDS
jgi:Fur family peroxide stress response transcriptional regulator